MRFFVKVSHPQRNNREQERVSASFTIGDPVAKGKHKKKADLRKNFKPRHVTMKRRNHFKVLLYGILKDQTFKSNREAYHN